MFPKALKVERLPINEEFPVPDLDRPHAEQFLIRIQTLPILPQFDHTAIQIGVPRLPEMYLCDGELAGRSGAAGNAFTGLVVKGDANLRCSLGLDGVSYPRIRSIYLRRQGDIADIGFRGGIEFDRALDACVVEKVKVRGIGDHFSQAGNVFLLIIAHRKRGMVHDIVDRDRQAIFAAADERVDFCLERRKSPLVLDDKLSIDIDFGGMRH